jgi:hypothetical protein
VLRLVIVTVASGIWTAVFALLVAILVCHYAWLVKGQPPQLSLQADARKDALWYTMFDNPLCTLYLSTLLVNLNSRDFVKGEHSSWFSQLSTAQISRSEDMQGLARFTGSSSARGAAIRSVRLG